MKGARTWQQTGPATACATRGGLQLTGRANYCASATCSAWRRKTTRNRAAEPVLSLRIACEFWKKKNLNRVGDADDIVEVPADNGGNGLDDWRALTAKAKAAAPAGSSGFVLSGEAPPSKRDASVLRRGSRGDAVGELQRMLQRLGFMVAG